MQLGLAVPAPEGVLQAATSDAVPTSPEVKPRGSTASPAHACAPTWSPIHTPPGIDRQCHRERPERPDLARPGDPSLGIGQRQIGAPR